jgi:hypothetical protein
MADFGGGFSLDGGGSMAMAGGAPGGGIGGLAGMGGAMGPAGAVLSGIQTLGALWGAWQQNKMAKKQFKFTKDITNTNLANQIKSYNTALYDRARSRGVVEGQSQNQIDAYINDNSLSRKPGETSKYDGYTSNNSQGMSGGSPLSYTSSYSSPMASSPTTPVASSAGGLSGFAALASRASAARTAATQRDETVH